MTEANQQQLGKTLPVPRGRGALLTQGGHGRDREERFQPEHLALYQHGVGEAEIDLDKTHQELVEIEKAIAARGLDPQTSHHE
jgi:hypothetical protein